MKCGLGVRYDKFTSILLLHTHLASHILPHRTNEQPQQTISTSYVVQLSKDLSCFITISNPIRQASNVWRPIVLDFPFIASHRRRLLHQSWSPAEELGRVVITHIIPYNTHLMSIPPRFPTLGLFHDLHPNSHFAQCTSRTTELSLVAATQTLQQATMKSNIDLNGAGESRDMKESQRALELRKYVLYCAFVPRTRLRHFSGDF